MTKAEIQEIVRQTVDELMDRNVFKSESYSTVLGRMSGKLYSYFSKKNNEKTMPELKKALGELADDPYIDVIYSQYRDHHTLDWTAEYLGCDISTVKRNKKRLIKKLYEVSLKSK